MTAVTARDVLAELGQHLVQEPAGAMEPVYEAVAGALVGPFVDQPALAQEARASTRSNVLAWARLLLSGAEARLDAPVDPAVLEVAREAFRRGQEDMLLIAYQRGQHVLWRYCQRHLFVQGLDVALLEEVLETGADSLASYLDVLQGQLTARLRDERQRMAEDRHEQRAALVNLVLEGAPVSVERASERLGYPLAGSHLAAVLWTDPGAPDPAVLRRGVEEFVARAGVERALWVRASPSSTWVWVSPGAAFTATGAENWADPLAEGVWAALGSPGRGVEGFSASHVAALATQRAMYRAPRVRIARSEDVRAVALATRDEPAALDFASAVLGDLASGPADLREALRVHARHDFNTAATARALFVHRNTAVGRLGRAEALLPAPAAGRGTEIGLALEILHWLGPARA